ncbi:MAG: GTP pyrophosphokinase family protein [Clostridia bacterium]|uniref:GTP pyrophosphokinase family protein n=2 Tax=Mogibacterium kristiansenii TaxID=2606708 RepID=A0A6N7XMF5_9FIRM|nr:MULTISPECIES: GTP pyrophosphokinase family protein [Mogibacterium]MDY5451247.1 GTP pyrophosphokinase family protein [Clostridia bacterium]MBN2936102.1 GTP pyrophosphokinase family protein [Mogibacterium sp.]MCI7123044.1 GTP pyrophosphokinase family protein [Mogibacterium sp.]MDD6699591.1 GTP pyrophosphokinase family protein [Mogibacterium kristiansenii]MEE0369668.1 GTP pyrophosphokinase family protein [Clostridia bacterium]
MTFTQYYKPDDMSASVPEHLQTDEDLQQQIMDINLLYSAAIREVSTKLDVLGDDFRMKHSYVPIHHMQSRLKSFESLMDKAERYGIEDPIHNLDTVRAEVFDIAGIRVVCNYREDIYTMSELLLKQSDVDLIKIKDYCKNPKPSGYRSLHVVISIPVFLVNSKTTVPVEIQFRSIAMDTWASLEHELKYKNKGALTEDIQKQLTQCAKTLSDVDEQMERIRHQVF